MSVRYGVNFKIDGEVEGFVPKKSYVVITFKIDENIRQKAVEFLSEAFNIGCERITIVSFRKLV